jgi:Fibronectin type III domain/Pentapeptide repeats (8 copies)
MEDRRRKRWAIVLGVALFALVSVTVVGAMPANARTVKLKKPGAPTDVQLRGIAMGVTVSWSAPTSDGGSPITGYTVSAGSTGQTCSTSGTSCTVTGLTEGRHYSIRVAATNAIGTGKKATVKTQIEVCNDLYPGTDLAGANLRNCDLESVDLADADLNDAIFYLVMRDSNLTGATVQDASMVGTDLEGTNLTDADMTGTVVDNGGLEFAIFSNTTCPDGTNSNSDGGTCYNHAVS